MPETAVDELGRERHREHDHLRIDQIGHGSAQTGIPAPCVIIATTTAMT
jgi:hypothetical protein